jgi:signal transduction histidine kinase
MDQLPLLLQARGRALKQCGDSDAHQHFISAVEHGEQRWESGWSLTEVVRDYQLLQLVVLEYLEVMLNRPLLFREVMAVGVFINDAIAASIAAFVANRDEYVDLQHKERTEPLEQANRRKDEFMAMLAYELRNPLAPIQNSIHVLHRLLEKDDPKVLKAIGVVERQTNQLARLVDDLLDLARIGRGRLELRKTQVNLATVLEHAIQTAEPPLKVREQQLTVVLPEDPLYVHADAARLVQVFVNLLHNAVKYTPEGGHIWLTAERDGNEAVIRVRDNGMGVPREMLSRIFELFAQTDGSQQYKQGGLGIGLALVHRLVEMHGGTVTCNSAGVGHGSEFVVRMLASTNRGQPIAPESCPQPTVLASCHVLIVDDYADSREMLATLLDIMGHRVERAENGSRGIEMALASRPQVGLVDIGLPDVDGYEVARQVRAALGGSIYLIALTGYGQEEDVRRSLDAGFDAHLVKPPDLAKLQRMLARGCGKP